MLISTHTLCGLALEGHAPRFFTSTNRFGTPWLSVTFTGPFILLGYLIISSTATAIFKWLQDLVSPASFIYSINIEIVYL